MAKKQNIEELVAEQTETVTEEVIETIEPTTHTIVEGDTWVSISELYRGVKTNNSYAKELIAKNGDKLVKGAIINL